MINLQAAVPGKPCFSSTVCSHCIAPSGIVPGDDVVDRAVKLREGGEGARLNRLFQILDRVLCANCKDRCVISFFFQVLDVSCNSTTDSE
jgi:hypothetical protein